MHYIELHVRTHSIVHGYDENNQLIIELVNETAFTKKLIATRRIESLSQEYLLVTLSHGRIAYWEFEESFEAVKLRLG